MQKRYYVYIMTNKQNKVLYIGVTDDIFRRAGEHCSDKSGKSFTSRYNLRKLVYVEDTGDIRDAIAREKQLKGWLRARKIELISRDNPEWKDLLLDDISSHPLLTSYGRQD